MMKNLDDLKKEWLSLWPESSHSLDQDRFIRYAIELARVKGALDLDEMKKKIEDPDRIYEYQKNYEFLQTVLKVLEEEKSEI